MLQYAITDQIFQGDERQRREALLDQAKALAAAQVDFLQLRRKDLPPEDLLALARVLRAALPPGTRPRLLVNGPAATAAEAGADGIHLPGGWSAADLLAARATFHNAGLVSPILSVSVHTPQEARAASVAGANLILFGPVFEKRVQGELIQPGVGLAALAEAARVASPTPVLALGGITAANAGSCLATGAAGIAAIRYFLPSRVSAPHGA